MRFRKAASGCRRMAARARGDPIVTSAATAAYLHHILYSEALQELAAHPTFQGMTGGTGWSARGCKVRNLTRAASEAAVWMLAGCQASHHRVSFRSLSKIASEQAESLASPECNPWLGCIQAAETPCKTPLVRPHEHTGA